MMVRGGFIFICMALPRDFAFLQTVFFWSIRIMFCGVSRFRSVSRLVTFVSDYFFAEEWKVFLEPGAG